MRLINVLAIITTRSGARDQVMDQLRAIQEVVRAEDGCIEYQIAVDVKNASATQACLGSETFVVIEKWAGLVELKAHAASPHMAHFSSSTSEMVVDKTVHIMESA